MIRQGISSALSLSALLLFAAAALASETPAISPAAAVKSKAAPVAVKQTGVKADPKAAGKKPPSEKPPSEKPAEAKETLGDGFITQNTLRVYLARPATVTLHNAMGQLIFQLESGRPMEALPLSGVTTGFLYLTLRAGQLELTKKLVYSGK